MSIITKLIYDDKTINVLSWSLNFHQNIDYNGKPNSRPKSGGLNLTIETIKESDILEWMINPNLSKQLKLQVISARLDKKSRTLLLSDAHCIHYEEVFNNKSGRSTIVNLKITFAGFNEGNVEHSEYWRNTFITNTPITKIEEDEEDEEDTQVAIDIYIDSQTGHRFKEIKPSTDIYRIINHHDYSDILSEYSNNINSKEAIDKLKSVSKEVIINDKAIQQEIQSVQDFSRKTEYQLYIVLSRNWIDPLEGQAIITAEKDTTTKQSDREDGFIKMNIQGRKGDYNQSKYYKSPKGNLVIAQVHGHNKDQRNNYENIEGTSETDRNTATGNGFNIYSIRAYNTKTGDQALIDKVDGNGLPSLNVGATQGYLKREIPNRKATFNIGKDAIDFWSQNPKKK